MTLEELKEVIGECLEDKDKLYERSEEIVNAYAAILQATKTQEEENEKLKQKNDQLRDACGMWMNRAGFISGNSQEEKEETYEELSKQFKNRMKGIK